MSKFVRKCVSYWFDIFANTILTVVLNNAGINRKYEKPPLILSCEVVWEFCAKRTHLKL